MQTASVLSLLGNIQLESLTISADAMPGHHVARAVIFDLQPSQMVAALMAVEDQITQTYPHARRTGWRAANDSLTVYFSAWTKVAAAAAA